jgi:hypothetical protein
MFYIGAPYFDSVVGCPDVDNSYHDFRLCSCKDRLKKGDHKAISTKTKKEMYQQ